AAHVGKAEVHESDVRPVFPKTFNRLSSVRRLRHHQHAWLAIDDHGNPFANKSMIIDTKNPDGSVHNCLVELPCEAGPMASARKDSFARPQTGAKAVVLARRSHPTGRGSDAGEL